MFVKKTLLSLSNGQNKTGTTKSSSSSMRMISGWISRHHRTWQCQQQQQKSLSLSLLLPDSKTTPTKTTSGMDHSYYNHNNNHNNNLFGVTRRYFSIDTSTSSAFDRDLKQKQRNNAARSHLVWNNNNNDNGDDDEEEEDIVDYNYFRQEMAYRLVDRLDDIKRGEGFPLALDIGSGPGYIHKAICLDDAFDGGEGGIGGVRKLVQLDSSQECLHRDDNIPIEGSHRCESYQLHANEEDNLPFPDGTFDLVLSSQALHWVNDLPGLFKEVKRVLKPDGCFMFSMIGGSTLPELRISLVLAEMEREGGVGAHVGPFVELSDVGSLLQNAGFSLPTIDIDTVRISYPNATVLMEHLQRMGEGNASLRRRDYTGKDIFLAASCIYDEMFQLEGEDTDVEATAQVIYAIGWSPHATQQQPSKRGSASHRVGEIVEKHQAGDS